MSSQFKEIIMHCGHHTYTVSYKWDESLYMDGNRYVETGSTNLLSAELTYLNLKFQTQIRKIPKPTNQWCILLCNTHTS